MVFDAEKLRPAVEHVTRLANDFGFANMLFIKNCSLHLRDIPRPPATGIHSGRTWREPLALHSDPVVSFETEELVHCRGRDPVSAYPLIGLTFKIDCSYIPKIFHTISETLPEPLKFHAPLLKRFTGLLCIIVQFHLEQSARILLSTPVAAIGETPLLPSPPPDVEIPNEGFQTGDLYEDIHEGSMSGERTSTSQTLSNFHHLPFSCFSPLSTGAQTQSSTFMDSDVAKDLMMPIPSSMEVGDCHPKCNNLVVPLAPSHEYTQDPPKQDLRNLDKLPLECEHLAFQVTSPEEDECIKSPTVVQATTEFMDLDDGEDLATLLERLPHHQLGDIGDQVASVEATLMEGCNPDINDMVLTSVPGDIEGNELNSLCGYEHVMEPPHPFAFSQQPFVQFDEYL
ncbi:unnamed protein product [Sphagnum tenellum]